MKLIPAKTRWTREEYRSAAGGGWFEGQRVQLIGGEVIAMSAMGYAHVRAVRRIERLLAGIFEPDDCVRAQATLSIDDENEPEPDVSVIRGRAEDYTDHPSTALLVVEVSDTSLKFDKRKAALYASARVPEYWVVDLTHGELILYREPVPDSATEFGHRYADVRTLAGDEHVSPLARPEARLTVRELLS